MKSLPKAKKRLNPRPFLLLFLLTSTYAHAFRWCGSDLSRLGGGGSEEDPTPSIQRGFIPAPLDRPQRSHPFVENWKTDAQKAEEVVKEFEKIQRALKKADPKFPNLSKQRRDETTAILTERVLQEHGDVVRQYLGSDYPVKAMTEQVLTALRDTLKVQADMGSRFDRLGAHAGELTDFGRQVRQVTPGEFVAFQKIAEDRRLPEAVRAPFRQCVNDIGELDGYMPTRFPEYAASLGRLIKALAVAQP